MIFEPPINLSSRQQNLIHSFVKHDTKLSILLGRAKREPENLKDIVAMAMKLISDSLKDQVLLPETFPRYIIPKVIAKIQSTLKNFINLDPDNGEAELMLREIEEAKQHHPASSSSSSSVPKNESSPSPEDGDSVLNDVPIPFPWKDHHEFNHSEAYNKLGDREKRCLSFCCGLLPHKPRDKRGELVEMSKRELIHWWTGMDFIKDPLEGDRVLEKLVAEGFLIKKKSHDPKMQPIVSRISNSSSTNRYMMHTSTLSKLKGVTLFMRRASETEKDVHIPLYMVQPKERERVFDGRALDAKNDDDVRVTINRRINMLMNYNLEKFFATKNVKILHLGSWPYDPTVYVSVEEIGALESFLESKCNRVTSLSLRGVAGIVDLPRSIYRCKALKVLDLKACPNLVKMPKGISTLKSLTHLDVSECYCLDYIPKGIERLSELQVLKGFIINPPECVTSHQCSFNGLPNLKKLVNLGVRAKVTNFPTDKDLETLSRMQQLKKLMVTWVLKNGQHPPMDGRRDILDDKPLLPAALDKLYLKAAPEFSALRVLDLISNGYRSANNCPQKLYITGCRLGKLDPFKYSFCKVKILRLRHLPELYMKWIDCRRLFPNLSHLEVYNCPNLIFFPCDEAGMGDESEKF